MSSLIWHIRHIHVAHGWLVPLFLLGAGLAMVGLFFVSPFVMLAIALGLLAIVAACVWPWETLVGILFFLPFEQLFLSFLPDTIYIPARYLSEALLYIVLIRVILTHLLYGKKFNTSAFDIPLASLFVVAVISAAINVVPFEIGLLGLRNIFRFLIIAWLVVQLRPTRISVQKIVFAVLMLAVVESIIGLAQALIGYRADELLQTTDRDFLEGITNVIQSWDPGRRISATLGRYDRFGTWLSLALLMATGLLYELKDSIRRRWLWLVLLVGVPALAMTQSRASWFGFALGIFVICVLMKRDRRVIWVFVVLLCLIVGYLVYSGLVVQYLLDPADAGLAERFFEALSLARWRAEYFDLGRLYFVVQTPIKILTHAPLFGVGPGRYGGGVAAALHVTTAYDQLGLPFGSGGEGGFIDNNWLSLFGEIGVLGALAYAWLIAISFKFGKDLWRTHLSPFNRGFGLGLIGLLCAVLVEAFLGTHLEVRTFAAYLWFFVGVAALLINEHHVAKA